MDAAPVSMASLDGEIMPAAEATIPATDEGLLRGDGAFEVLRVYDGKPYAMEEHMQRLERSAANLRLPVDLEVIRADTYRLLASVTGQPGHDALRIVVTRGGHRLLLTEPLHVWPERIRLRTITYSPTRILDGVKSLSYAANMLATRLAVEEGFDEALLVTPHGRVLEAPTSSIFWVEDGELMTPPLDERILASITRAAVIDVTRAKERGCTLDELLEADETFLASTTREVQPVSAIDEREFDGVGPITAAAAKAMEAQDRVGADRRLKVLTVIGNRPQFVKAAAVSPRLREADQEVLVHTGQHFDDQLSGIFFTELGLPAPDQELAIALGSNTSQTARMLAALERVIDGVGPDAVLVYGDTNSTLAGALSGAQAGVPVVHVEAGMRSGDRSMPEELNRVLTDHASSLLLCSTPGAVDNLRREGIAGEMELVGDVMVDIALAVQPRVRERADLIARWGVEAGEYVLVTAHRAGNVDDPARLRQLVDLVLAVPRPVLFALHPRTRARLTAAGLLDRLEHDPRTTICRRSATSSWPRSCATPTPC